MSDNLFSLEEIQILKEPTNLQYKATVDKILGTVFSAITSHLSAVMNAADVDDFAMEQTIKIMENLAHRMEDFNDNGNDIISYLIVRVFLKRRYYDWLAGKKEPSVNIVGDEKSDESNSFWSNTESIRTELKDEDSLREEEDEKKRLQNAYTNIVRLQLSDDKKNTTKSINASHIYASQQQYVRLNLRDELTTSIKEKMQTDNPSYNHLPKSHENAAERNRQKIARTMNDLEFKNIAIEKETRLLHKIYKEKNSDESIESQQQKVNDLKQDRITLMKEFTKHEDQNKWAPLSADDIMVASDNMNKNNLCQIKSRYLKIKDSIVIFDFVETNDLS